MRRKAKSSRTILLVVLAVMVAGIFLVTCGNIDKKKINVDAGFDVEVVSMKSYTGPYMEDGSDIEVKDILSIVIKNNGEDVLQYAELTLKDDAGETAQFHFSTLEPGQSMTVLEVNKKEYNKDTAYTSAFMTNVALFPGKLKTYEDQLKIQPLEGGLNVTNISEKDITKEIVIYFKDCQEDMLMGGITYRGRIPGGIRAGEIAQLMSENFTKENTKVMFITIDGE